MKLEKFKLKNFISIKRKPHAVKILKFSTRADQSTWAQMLLESTNSDPRETTLRANLTQRMEDNCATLPKNWL